jgi:hypothetical protein
MKKLLFSVVLAAGTVLAADSPATFKVSELTFKRPAKWESVPPASAMRKAQLRIPGDAGASADIVFFHFGPGDGGGTQANIDRWFMQFKDARDKKVSDTKVGGQKIIYVSTQGTYNGGMPGQMSVELKDHALLGAIIEQSQGNIFVKLTGPAALVKSSDPEFRKMVEGALK